MKLSNITKWILGVPYLALIVFLSFENLKWILNLFQIIPWIMTGSFVIGIGFIIFGGPFYIVWAAWPFAEDVAEKQSSRLKANLVFIGILIGSIIAFVAWTYLSVLLLSYFAS